MIIHGEFFQKSGDDPTEAWNNIRLGKVTASECGRFVKLDGTLRSGDMPLTYMCEKVFEKWTGRAKQGSFFSMPVNNGLIVEQKAAAFAALEYGLEIRPVGFVSNDEETAGVSPDGIIGFSQISKDKPTSLASPPSGASGFETKSPELCTHIEWLLGGKLPNEHLCQVQSSMFFTGCQSWHFLSYTLACYLDGFPPLHLVIERDDEWQKNFAESISVFLERLDASWKKLVEINGGEPKRVLTYQPTPKPEKEIEDYRH